MQTFDGKLTKETISEILRDLGINTKLVDYKDCPTYTMFYYDLYDITNISKLPKVVKYISAYLHANTTIRTTTKSHFALAVEKAERQLTNYNDMSYKFKLGIAKPYSMLIGKDENNVVQTISFEDVPHILISGATGSGKSVLLNNMLCSLIEKTNEEDLGLILIDPKRVELSQYNELDNYLEDNVVNDVESAIDILEMTCKVMDNRYAKMQQLGVRDAKGLFRKIVIVIDEFADLMNWDKLHTERYIVRIAQLGRACGIHLLIATQRPTVDVITGNIKANINCRIALQMASFRDSITILDHKGAEKLKGKGDLLLKLPSQVEEIHCQCPFIDDKTIQKIINKNKGE